MKRELLIKGNGPEVTLGTGVERIRVRTLEGMTLCQILVDTARAISRERIMAEEWGRCYWKALLLENNLSKV